MKAGVVMLAALGALLGLLYVASGETLWGSWRYVHIRFEPGKLAPQEDTAVRMNGVVVGRVQEVRLKTELRRGADLTPEDRRALGLEPEQEGTFRETYVLVVARLRSEQAVPVGTTAEISEGITGSVQLALLAGHSPETLSDADTHRVPIEGREAIGLAGLSARIDELVKEIGKLAKGGGGVLDEAKALLSSLKSKVDAIDAQGISADVRESAAALRRVLGALEERVATIAANFETASADMKRMASSGASTLEGVDKDVDDLLATLKEVARKLDRILDRAGPKIDGLLDSVGRASASMERLAKEFSGLGPDARLLLKDLGADVGELVRTFSDTAHNLLDASEDIRSRPWILMNKPDEEQIAFDNVRVATQNYARAMAEMREAASQLARLAQSPGSSEPETRRLVQEALARFRSSQDRYQLVERALLQILQQTGRPGGR
jgi:ABC-type transporter Mla subunit MlaD